MKKCSNCGLEVETDQVFCTHCGYRLTDMHETDSSNVEQLDQKGWGEAAQKRARHKWIILSVVLLAGCAFSAILAFDKGNEASYYKRWYYSQSSEYSTLKKQNTSLAEQVEFMDKCVAIIDTNSDDNLYHTYGCRTWDWDSDWSVLVYTPKGAEARAYEPCPECHQ